jgi:hypothetical protein
MASPTQPDAYAPFSITINTGDYCYPTGLGDGATVTTSGSIIDVLLLTTCPAVLGVPPPPYVFSAIVGPLFAGAYSIRYRRSFRLGGQPYGVPEVLATAPLYVVGADVAKNVSVSPVVPSSTDDIQVTVFLASAQVRSQAHTITGNSIVVTIANDGPSFLPNPPGFAVEHLGSLPPGAYTLNVVVLPDANPIVLPLVVTPANNTSDAVEFYNAELDHYFLTASAVEMAALDAGAFRGWSRTGEKLMGVLLADPLVPAAQAPLTPVCRLYGLPSAGLDTHFFSASPAECAEVQAKWPGAWVLETPAAFYVLAVDQRDGTCPAGSTPVFRLYNNRGDVNHRYTTSPDIRAHMIDMGWVPEGYGPAGVAMCAPR